MQDPELAFITNSESLNNLYCLESLNLLRNSDLVSNRENLKSVYLSAPKQRLKTNSFRFQSGKNLDKNAKKGQLAFC